MLRAAFEPLPGEEGGAPLQRSPGLHAPTARDRQPRAVQLGVASTVASSSLASTPHTLCGCVFDPAGQQWKEVRHDHTLTRCTLRVAAAVNAFAPLLMRRRPAGQQWKEVRHDNTVTWLAFWRDPVNTKEYK